MAQASKICPYEQGYLSLLARRGELRARKKGRNWYTKIEWLNEYLEEKKPEAVIVDEKTFEKNEVLNKKEKNLFRATWIWLALTTVIALVGFFVFTKFLGKINVIEKNSGNFVTEEIVKVPNENGSYDIYNRGLRKVSQ